MIWFITNWRGEGFLGKYKIAVYAICKNEEKFVDKWVDSMQEADGIFVTDTGSDDNTVQKLKSRGVVVNSVKLSFWRFDVARNISLNFVPEDYDICICTDLDEILEKGWRKLLEEVWEKDKTTRLKYMYTWSFYDDGKPKLTFWYEKIHTRKNFRWTHPVHEILEYYSDKPEHYSYQKNIQLNHYPDTEKSRGQYLNLLELSVKESPNDDRNMHYLGREYMFYKMWDKCIETLQKHLNMPSATWKDERCASMRYISRAYIGLGDYENAQSWLYKAIAETPYLREPYVEMAQLAYKQKDWIKVYFMITEALKIKSKPQIYLSEPFCWNSTIYDLGAIACYNLGLYQKSLEFAKTANEMNPNDERLIQNLKIIKKKFAEVEK